MVLFKGLSQFHATEWQVFDVPVLTWFYNQHCDNSDEEHGFLAAKQVALGQTW